MLAFINFARIWRIFAVKGETNNFHTFLSMLGFQSISTLKNSEKIFRFSLRIAALYPEALIIFHRFPPCELIMQVSGCFLTAGGRGGGGAHFSYLLARPVIGLQLGENPMSLLQHGADLVPHGRLCLRGLSI